MPYTTNVAGTTITASWGNANVRDQVVTPFTDSTARSSAISVPVAGMLSALTTSARLDVYNGSSWSAILAPAFGVGAAWTPTLTATTTNPTLGTGSAQTGTYFRMGRLVVAFGRIVFGTAGAAAGSGTYQLSLPVPSVTTGFAHGVARHTGGAAARVGIVTLASATLMNIFDTTSGALITDAVPGVWTNNNFILYTVIYEAASDG